MGDTIRDTLGNSQIMSKEGESQVKLDTHAASALSRLFSVAVLRDLGKHSSSPLFARLLEQTRLNVEADYEPTVGTAFNEAFKLLSKPKHRDDYVYRAAITKKIFLGRHSLKTATLLNEVRAGACRADIVVLNGTSTAYEIKSERDSLARLGYQISNYRRVFASVNVVVGKSHLLQVMRTMPEDVGIITLSDRFNFQTVRPALNQPENIVPTMLLDVLRVNEATDILLRLGYEIPVVPNTRIRSELRRIFATLEPAEVHEEMVNVVKESRSLEKLADFIVSVPFSLQAAYLAMKPSLKSREHINKAVATPLAEALAWK